MLYTKITKREALDQLTSGDGALSLLAAEAILDDVLSFLEDLEEPHWIDFDAIKNNWFEEDITDTLDMHEVQSLSELDDLVYYLTPPSMEGKVLYFYFDDDRGIKPID